MCQKTAQKGEHEATGEMCNVILDKIIKYQPNKLSHE